MPRKVLREIGGVPMVVYVFRRAQTCRMLSDLLVATDSDEVIEACHAHHIPAVLTSPEHRSGTDRLWEVSRARVADVYVNIQGDEPLVTIGHIETLVRPFLQEPEVQVTTLKIRATPDEAVSPTVNKVVTNAHGDALYFSKHAIPFDRDKRGVTYWKHIGLYAYRRPVLDVFHRLPPSTLERAEGLEQLRLLEEGIPIRVLETAEPTVGVDTEEDLRAVEAVLARRGR
jgi:3-deoxy-manno-octulosonate cytidylyltransferase (CMP-KDO synthetase)